MNVRVRQESVSDYEAVYKLLVDAFGQEDEAKLVDMLRRDPCFVEELSLVATHDERIIGYILLSRISIVENDLRNLSLALAPMAVDPAYQRGGIGGQLIREAHKQATWLGFDSVIVLGHEHYYPRFGYKPADTWGIRCPYPVSREVFMGKELIKGSLEGISGLVEYPKPFSTL